MDNRQIDVLDIRLAETLDISITQELHSELRSALDSGVPVSLHGSAVERVDTAALQLLVAMFIYADGHKYRLEWQSPSEALIRSAALLGVDRHIGLTNKNSFSNH